RIVQVVRSPPPLAQPSAAMPVSLFLRGGATGGRSVAAVDRRLQQNGPWIMRARMNTSNQTVWEQNLRNLTAQACRAAELGRWDQVEECYRLRGMQLRDHSIPQALATDLTAFDLEIAARIVNARLAVESQLIHTAKIRQRFLGLRSWQGLREVDHTLMD